jgi:hypothetical protein
MGRLGSAVGSLKDGEWSLAATTPRAIVISDLEAG